MQYRHTPLPGWNDNIYDNYIPYIVLIVFLCNFLNSQYDIYFESGEQKMPCLIPCITIEYTHAHWWEYIGFSYN